MKTCKNCGETKSNSKFHQRKGKPDGRRDVCIICVRRYPDLFKRDRELEAALKEAKKHGLEEYMKYENLDMIQKQLFKDLGPTAYLEILLSALAEGYIETS